MLGLPFAPALRRQKTACWAEGPTQALKCLIPSGTVSPKRGTCFRWSSHITCMQVFEEKTQTPLGGFTQKTRKIHCGPEAVFGELFCWPHYGKLVMGEVLSITVYNCSKVFSNRLLGTLVLSLQHLMTSGRLIIREALVDRNHRVTGIYIELDLRYVPPDGSAGTWVEEDFVYQMKDSSELIIHNPGFEELQAAEGPRASELDRRAAVLGRKLAKGLETDEEEEDEDFCDASEMEVSGIVFSPVRSRSRLCFSRDLFATPAPQSFQVGINIIEAQKLVGVNINPFVVVKVGEEKKHTATQKSTNCPFYNEYFLFEFHEPRDTLFHRLIEILVFHSKKIPFLGTCIGTFKMDIATVYSQPDHRFFQKWAVISDPTDTRAGVKGFVKCNISVTARGDVVGSLPTSSSSRGEDIERNLLLPKRVPAERPWARVCIKLYRAEGLPSMSAGIMGGFSKIIGEKKVFIDPYVRVSFCGQQGETSVETNTTEPEWNEQISFIEMFPPLARKIKVQVLDDASVGDVAIATHYIDLQQISDPGRNGFNPTFGPAWVNLYGSPQNSALRDIHKDLNEGMGEGIFYRGRILMAITVEIFSSLSMAERKLGNKMKGALSKLKLKKKSKKFKEKAKELNQLQGEEEAGGSQDAKQPREVTVEVEELHPLPEKALGRKEEFLLFTAFFEATMMDPSLSSKFVSFEISIGNYGKAAEVVTKVQRRVEKGEAKEEEQPLLDPGSDGELNVEALGPASAALNKSVTKGQRPEPMEYDRSYSCLPMTHEKPCVYVWSYWEDHTWRLCISNWIVKLAERLEQGLDHVEKLMRRPKAKAEEQLRDVLEEFVAGCRQYSLSTERKTMAHPNNLDRCRMKYLMRNIVLYAKQGLRVRQRLTQANVKEKVKETRRILAKLRFMAKEPQCTLPDVLVWMLSNNRRVAYARIPAQNILYSVVEEEKGKDCAKIQTVFMKVPGLHTGEIFAKLEIYMWLGVTKYAKNCLMELPEEFKYLSESGQEIAQLLAYSLPSWLSRDDFSYFQLRAHLYQARGILPADDNGLSDPFVRVVFSTYCQTTRMLEETLSPLWNELLLFDQLIIDGKKEELKTETPIIIINLFSHNKFGSPEFLGQAFAVPQVKLVDEPYTKPALQFFDFYKGTKAVGELIATFELIELDYSGYLEPSVPEDVEPKEPDYLGDPHAGRFIIPEGIRPVLKEFRIEILFWGLRNLKRVNLFEVDQPQVIIECAGKKVESEVIVAYKENPNFTELVKYMDVELPEQVYLHPPLSIFVVEKRAFGRTVLVGTHIVSDVMKFSPRELEEEPEDVLKAQKVSSQHLPSETVVNIAPAAGDPRPSTHPLSLVKAPLKKICINKLVKKEDEYEEEKPELEELDWWSKYYESLKELYNQTHSDEEDVENDDVNDAEGGNLNASSIDVEAEDEIAIEAEPARPKRKLIATLQIYNSELENEFGNFEDWLCIFPLHRGKASEDEDGNEDEHFVGKYKGSFYVYPTEEAGAKPKVSQGVPRNRPIKVLVRVYIIKATNLSPADPNGKADPYVVVTVGQEQKDTKERYIPKQLNPVFGEVVELTVSFPMESELTVAIFDHDLVGSDDLIGETKIDLENRFYSKHRANCGVASQYDINSYNMWRDAFKPTQILDSLCKKNLLPAPEYRREEVKVDNKIFKVPPEAFPEEASVRNRRGASDENWSVDDEHKALYVLQHWEEMPGYGYKLVPEHVEIRSLYNPENPGLVQGSLHMWIDMFPNDVPAPPPVNIKPRLPVSYELRVIIWNTDDVILDDVNPVTGEPSSDIYVKRSDGSQREARAWLSCPTPSIPSLNLFSSLPQHEVPHSSPLHGLLYPQRCCWIKGLDHNKQETDVHFNSLTGEGNFNWRFIFRFNYLPTEKEITYKKKDSVFSMEESEFREPAVLVLQVWDYDRISANDFLGSIELKLHDMVRAAKSSEHCTIKMAKEYAIPRFSIFRNKRMRGWWPFIKLKDPEDEEREEREDKQKKKKKKKKGSRSVKPEDVEFTDSSGNKYLLTGKVEAEFQLLTVEEAEKSPVGLGRKEPEPLEKPNRPKTSFNWFVNPMKTFVFFIWKRYKKYIIVLFIVAVLTIFLVLLVYTMPGYISEKIING
ncbi:fer-1-like protein 4 isoform X3 [Falco peregrinus]|uniref:fer-1-like protein 4 isoform X3 n=1 Tax=Falco peregrinus TaxID=8954 RepID=UPI000FFB16DE|nr:fer-1-like protein 4 isoform X3 [Falco peregrinus]